MEWVSNLTAIFSLIVVFGTACGVLAKFLNPFKKKRQKLKEQQDAESRQRIDEELTKVLPDILKAHDLETRDKYRADRENYLHEIKEEVLADVSDKLCTIDDVKSNVKQLQIDVEVMAKSAKDVLREKIMAIYHKGKATKSMPMHHREALDQYYKDYKAMNGNSYIDKYFNRMKSWEVLDDDYDEE